MRKLTILLLVVSTVFIQKTNAQMKNGKISGTVIDGKSKVIESATITLRNVKDSSVAKISVADKDGNYVFENIAEGSYFVSITAVGHEPAFSETVEIKESSPEVSVKKLELV